jgi:hypothetical protein
MATLFCTTVQASARTQRLNRKKAARRGCSLSFAQIVAARSTPDHYLVSAAQPDEARVFAAVAAALAKEGLAQ